MRMIWTHSNPDSSGSSTALLWFTLGQGFGGRRYNNMGDMADLIADGWCHWGDEDYFGHDPEESVPFRCPCKWCREYITMTPTEDGWKPMKGGKLHICEARIKSQQKAMVAQMPDLTLPECQFCHTPMKWLKGEPDFEESWSPHFFLSCSKCGATGPRVEHGHEDYEHLSKTVK